MNNSFISFVFTLFTLSLLIRIISYGIYEIKNEKNKFGGVTIIVFSIAVIIFSNIMVWVS